MLKGGMKLLQGAACSLFRGLRPNLFTMSARVVHARVYARIPVQHRFGGNGGGECALVPNVVPPIRSAASVRYRLVSCQRRGRPLKRAHSAGIASFLRRLVRNDKLR